MKISRTNSALWRALGKTLMPMALLFITPFVMQAAGSPGEWKLDKEVKNVEFYHSIQECNGKQVVFLKMINKNKYAVKLTWKEVFTTQEGPQIEGFAGEKSIVTGAGETSEADCGHLSKKQLVILAHEIKPTYIANILKFDYASITVSNSN